MNQKEKELFALNYLQQQHKLPLHQAAGLVGTFVQESSMNTGARNKGDGRDGSDSVGVGQWNGNRAKGLHAFAAERGEDWQNLPLQLDYAIKELRGSEGRAGAKLFNARNIDEASRAAISYERPAGFSWDNPTNGHGWSNRIGHAHRLAGSSPEEIAAASAYVPERRSSGGAVDAVQAMAGGNPTPSVSSAASEARNSILASLFAEEQKPDLSALGLFDENQAVGTGQETLAGDPREDDIVGGLIEPAQDPFAGLITYDDEQPQSDPLAGLIRYDDEAEAAPVTPETAAPAVNVSGIVTETPGGSQTDITLDTITVGPNDPPEEQGWMEWLTGVPSDPAKLKGMAENPKPQYGAGGEMLNSALFGGLDEITGALMSPIEYAKRNWIDGEDTTLGEAYATNRDRIRQEQKDYREENPVASTAAAIGGGFITGPGRALYQGGSKTLQALESIGMGAAQGGAAAFGEAEGDITERLDNALTGGGIGAVVGGIVPGIGAVARGGRAITGGTARDAAQVADDFADLGVAGTAGLVSGNKSAQVAERVLSPIPIIGPRISNRVDDAFGAFEREAGRTVDSLGTPRTAQEMGQGLQDAGARSEAVFRDRADRLYGRVDDHMAGELAESGATTRLLQDLENEAASLSNFDRLSRGSQITAAIGRARAISDDLNAGLEFDRLANTRSQIGRMYADARYGNDAVEAEYLNRIRLALTDDMKASTQRVGGNADRAFDRANAYYNKYTNKQSPDNYRNALGKTIQDRQGNLISPEQAFKWVDSGTKDGASKLAALRRQLYKTGERQTFDDLSATIMQRMGESVDGDEVGFSAAKFLTNWGKMSEEAKATLFRGTPNADYPANIERVVRLAKRFKDYGKSANHSNTGNFETMRRIVAPTGLIGGAAGLGSAFGLGLMSAGISTASATGFSVLLTNPQFTRWLAGAPRAQMQRGGLSQYVVNLGNMTKDVADPGMKNLIGQYIQTVQSDLDEKRR